MSDRDPSLSRPIRNRLPVAAAVLSTVALAACGPGKSQPVDTVKNTFPAPVEQIERQVTTGVVQTAAQRLAGQIMKLANVRSARREFQGIAIPCTSNGIVTHCYQPTVEELHNAKRRTAHSFRVVTPADPTKDFDEVDNATTYEFGVRHALPSGERDLTTVNKLSILGGSRKPYTSYTLDLREDAKLGGWDVQAEYFDADTRDKQFCFNTAIDKDAGQYHPLDPGVLDVLLADAEEELLQSAAGQTVAPLAIPEIAGGRAIGFSDYTGCKAA